MALEALIEETGSILAFLPGMGEIRRAAEHLAARLKRDDVDIAPLYGALDRRAQDLAIEPAPKGRRKIVLATSIAETSPHHRRRARRRRFGPHARARVRA